MGEPSSAPAVKAEAAAQPELATATTAGESATAGESTTAATEPTKAASPALATDDTTEPQPPSAELLAPSHWTEAANAAAEPGADDDADSALGDDDAASSSASLSSSIMDYRVINGRTFHAERGDAKYWASNDEQQNEALDMIHHMSTLSIDGRLFLAPLDASKVKKVLDVGTGTGIWAIDFADDFPDAQVVGTDISPIQPSWVPPNVRFEIDDFTQEWAYDADSFDYVHMRYLYGSVPDWYDLFRKAYRVTKPGGWIESYEGSPLCHSDDGSVPEGSALMEWGKIFIAGGRKMGRIFTPLPDHLQEKGLEAAGFVDVSVSTIKVPVGDWPADPRLKDVGRFSQLSLESDLEGYVMFMANLLEGWTKEDVTMYCLQMRREMRSPKTHPYYFQRIVWARKPEA